MTSFKCSLSKNEAAASQEPSMPRSLDSISEEVGKNVLYKKNILNFITFKVILLQNWEQFVRFRQSFGNVAVNRVISDILCQVSQQKLNFDVKGQR